MIKIESYETSDATIASKAVALHGSGANVLIAAATP
jgi:hypothetical protein